MADLLFLTENFPDYSANRPTDDRGKPEQPQLLQSPSTDKQACPVERAGLTDVLVTGMEIR